MSEQSSVGSSGEDAGDADGAGTGSAGERDPAAAFPGPHGDFAGRVHLDKMDVGAAGEEWGVLQDRADHFERDLRHITAIEDGAGVAGTDASYPGLCARRR